MSSVPRELHWIDAQLPRMRECLVRLASINSHSFNLDGLERMRAAVEAWFAPLGATAETIDLAPQLSTADDGSLRERPLGRALRLRRRPDAPLRVFFCGHLDTVFPLASSFQQVRSEGADRLHGPGVADLKGGLMALWAALSVLEASRHRDRIGWEVLFNPDEEVGSTGSAPLLREAAVRHHLGLIYEPALPDGSLAGARKGSGNFDLVVHGRAAHAGRDPAAGRNAIVACAHLAQGIDALNGRREGLTVNAGYVHGGGALNQVPELALLKFNVRTTQESDASWLHEQLDLLVTREQARRDGIRIELRGGFNRPPKVFDERNQRLSGLIAECGKELGQNIRFQPTGGCCDGNNLHAAGLPNVDNLGVVGGEIHTDREWMRVSSMVERGRLSALLLLRLAAGDIAWT